MATFSAPTVTRTASGFHKVKALTGPPDQDLHDRQWQYPIASGSPETPTWTAPQKHSPLCVVAIVAPRFVRHFPDNETIAYNRNRRQDGYSIRVRCGPIPDSCTAANNIPIRSLRRRWREVSVGWL